MSQQLRELLQKIGGGPHTSKNLSTEEAFKATQLILEGQATPAQIGAFMIAHRIKRPTVDELLGILEAYDSLGERLQTVEGKVVVIGNPYDGRTRTVPVTPITALILASVGIGVILHGGDAMPTKYGTPLVKIWQHLGVDFSNLTIQQTQKVFQKAHLALVYIPVHFPQAHSLVKYRDEIGKRPPFATVELVWSPYQGPAHILAGFVHPPTEKIFEQLLALRTDSYTTCKGLEGSIDLPMSRPAIIGLGNLSKTTALERCILNASDFGFSQADVELKSPEYALEQIKKVIYQQAGDLWESAIFNAGFYLWRLQICQSIEEGLTMANELLKSKQTEEQLKILQSTVKEYEKKIN
jgi:anthranilate phosphoribosyltransferase